MLLTRLALLLGAAVAATGCGASPLRKRSALPTEPGSAAMVEVALRKRGLRFGTDGSPESLFAYVRFNHELVPAAGARPGDLLFFNFAGRGCGDHVGLIEDVAGAGRITFRESRAGLVRRSYVHPKLPTRRRDSEGRVANSFLRPRRMDDPAGIGYFAGEMLCAVGRVEK